MTKIFTKKRIIASTIIGLIIIGVIAAIKLGSNIPMPETAVVTRQDLSHTLSASGQIKAEKQMDLTFETSGVIAYLAVKEGDQILAGDLIGYLDTQVLYNTFKQAEASLAKYQSIQRETWETYKTETQTNIIQEKLKQAQETVNTAQLTYDATKISLAKAYLYSPISGTVSYLPAEVGGYAVAGSTGIATVIDKSNIIFEAEIDEEDINWISSSSSAQISLDSFEEQTFTANVTKIGQQTQLNKNGDSIVKVELHLLEPGNNLIVGLNGDALFTLKEIKQVLAIPYEALITEKENHFVYVFKDNFLAKKTPITIGFENDYLVEVIDGLEENDIVAVDLNEKLTKKETLEFKN